MHSGLELLVRSLSAPSYDTDEFAADDNPGAWRQQLLASVVAQCLPTLDLAVQHLAVSASFAMLGYLRQVRFVYWAGTRI